jgi:hypothetical protein
MGQEAASDGPTIDHAENATEALLEEVSAANKDEDRLDYPRSGGDI